MFNIGWNQKNIDLIKKKFKDIISLSEHFIEFVDFVDEKYKFELENIFKWTNYLEIGNTLSYLYNKYIIKFIDFTCIRHDGVFFLKFEKGEKYEKIVNRTELVKITMEYDEIIKEKYKIKCEKEKEEKRIFLEKCIEEEKNTPDLIDSIKNDLPKIPKLIFEGNHYLKMKLSQIVIDSYDNEFEELFKKYKLLKLIVYELNGEGKFLPEIYTIGRYELEFRKEYYEGDNCEQKHFELRKNKILIYESYYSKLLRPFPTGDGNS